MSIGIFIAIFFASVIGMLVYAIPSFVAVQKDHDRKGSIIAINFLLGWTVVGWIISLVMSLRDE